MRSILGLCLFGVSNIILAKNNRLMDQIQWLLFLDISQMRSSLLVITVMVSSTISNSIDKT